MKYRAALVVLAALELETCASHAGIVYQAYLAGEEPKEINGPGEWKNETRVFPFHGVNTTSATLQSTGHWAFHLMTKSEVQNTTISGGNLQEAFAAIILNTQGQLVGPGPYPSFLTIKANFHADIQIGNNSHHDGSLTFGSFTIHPLEDLFFPDFGSYTVDLPLAATFPVSGTGSFELNFSLHSESWGRFGVTSGDYSNTFRITEILLPSGETPESQGWTLSFSDGRTSPNYPNLLVNGGFEEPDVGYGGVNNPDVPGWTIERDRVEIVDNAYWPAHEGLQSLDLNETDSMGVISQSFATIPGQRYRLAFTYGDNPIPVPETAADVTVTGDGVLLSESISHSSSTFTNMDYTLFQRDFVADSALTTLRFASTTRSHYGIVLDNVSVQVIPPFGLAGDFNRDGSVDEVDIDLLAAAADAHSNDPRFDLDGDGTIEFSIGATGAVTSDSDILIRQILMTEYGDLDLNGEVFLPDLITFATNYRQGGQFGWAQGNIDGGQEPGTTETPRVFLADLIALATYWRFGVGDGSGAAIVPEPSGLLLALCWLFATAHRRARHKQETIYDPWRHAEVRDSNGT